MTSGNYHVITPTTTASYIHFCRHLWNQGGMGGACGADFVSHGLERDLLGKEAVVQCFLAFRNLGERPKNFKWRRLNI